MPALYCLLGTISVNEVDCMQHLEVDLPHILCVQGDFLAG